MPRVTAASSIRFTERFDPVVAGILATLRKFDALAAGDLITTGTLTAALSVGAGENLASEISGLPITNLTLNFTE